MIGNSTLQQFESFCLKIVDFRQIPVTCKEHGGEMTVLGSDTIRNGINLVWNVFFFGGGGGGGEVVGC